MSHRPMASRPDGDGVRMAAPSRRRLVPAIRSRRAAVSQARALTVNQHMARIGVLLKVAAGAMIGALGAVGLVAVTNRIVHPRIVDATVLIVTVLCVVAVAMLTSEAAPESHPGSQTAGPQPSSGRNAAAYNRRTDPIQLPIHRRRTDPTQLRTDR